MTRKKKPVTKKAPLDAYAFLQKSLVALRELYPGDVTKPGVVLSSISEREFYASFLRYENDGSKVVVANGRGETLDDAIIHMLTNWTNGVRTASSLKREVRNAVPFIKYPGAEKYKV